MEGFVGYGVVALIETLLIKVKLKGVANKRPHLK